MIAPCNTAQFVADDFIKGALIAALRPDVTTSLSAENPAKTTAVRTIYSNDTTHILSCKCPWRDRKDDFTDQHLARSITEAAGVDAHFLQSGLGWIPW